MKKKNKIVFQRVTNDTHLHFFMSGEYVGLNGNVKWTIEIVTCMFEEHLFKRETRAAAGNTCSASCCTATELQAHRREQLSVRTVLRWVSSLVAPDCGFNVSLCNAIDVFGKLGKFEKCRCAYSYAETFVRV